MPGYIGILGKCAKCPIGRSSPMVQTSKDKMVSWFFAANEGSESCHQCPANTRTLKQGATSLNDCICAPGYVGNALKSCKPCPKYGMCPGDGKWKVVSGYLNSTSDEINPQIFPCRVKVCMSRCKTEYCIYKDVFNYFCTRERLTVFKIV